MLTEQEAQELMIELIKLRKQAKEANDEDTMRAFKKHEQLCIDTFKYLVFMRTSKYKQFSNYDDLNQEGFEALLKAMKNYDPKKGSWFWWAHKYIDTRISRHANTHTTIRFPLKVAKMIPPHKEASLPLLIEERFCPDTELENSELVQLIEDTVSTLNKKQRELIILAFGLNGEKPLSISKICKQKKISRSNCIKLINGALAIMKDRIEF